jgi:N-acylneuraminate cytidylyltransferase
LEIAWSRVVFEGRTISGTVLTPFFTENYEGFDVNHPNDLRLAHELIDTGKAQLPHVSRSRYSA